MISRRRFVGSSVAGCLASAAGAWGWAVDRMPLHATLFDERFAEAVRFGGAAQRHGLPARGVRGDMTDLWYRELEPLWRLEPRPIAGLTAYASLFCLERLAWDHGMRLVFHGTHDRLATGAVQHVVRGPRSATPSGEARWPEALAARLARQEQRIGWTALPPVLGATQARFQTPGPASRGQVEQPLHSWVIARTARELERT
jgi:hypothetical protein